jgi:hypothetical protein
MGSYHPFGHLKHKLWLKERPGIKVAVWFPTIKSQKLTRFVMYKQRETYRWKALDKGYNFSLDFIAIGGLHAKLCASKIARVQVVGISRLPLGSPGTKSHVDVALVKSCRVYYKGEGGGFPQVRSVGSFVCSSCPWLTRAPKVLQLCNNHFLLILCRSAWVIEAYQFPSPIPKLQHAPLPLYSARSQGVAPILYSFDVFSLGLTFESFKELGMCQTHFILHW